METTNAVQSLKHVFELLRLTFGIVPIVAGFDKFTNVLTNWEHYINPFLAQLLPLPAPVFMKIVGVIEIVAGIIVFRKAAVGGYIVAAWLTAIAVTLLVGFYYPDVAVRDLVMAIGAFSMAKMAGIFSSGKQ
ncbi:hypothetical protein LQ567_24410 [Niabella pedocola]|uniref:tRNA (5-methylaminomethyl-2-thiouridylate)-methyltransferase n=1 Tax=Niabella pedocola TaxID=1752077 RepID=A0ABS8PY08_9BACT|nr:hypothetical protein [Niabella pedocola]MCD2425949.1 hypothetical protein [Niabella pedocola]